MNTYTKLTAYLPILEADNFGKWIVDNESKGTVDSPIQMPYVTYSRMAVFCQVLFPEKSVGIPFFQQGIFPAFSGHYASLRMRACSIR